MLETIGVGDEMVETKARISSVETLMENLGLQGTPVKDHAERKQIAGSNSTLMIIHKKMLYAMDSHL